MSRLETNSEEYRTRIESRNLYSPEDPYRLEESDLIKSIDSIASILSPFGAPDISNSIIGRLANPINTPIQQIGLQMLAKQFAATVASLGRAEFQPSINFANLFDGDPNTKLVTLKRDFQITRRASQSGIGRFLEEVTGAYRPINPFLNNPTNIEYFKQTGKGQQISLINNLNKSKYKPSSGAWQAAVRDAKLKYPSPAELSQEVFFPTLNINFFPYIQYESGSKVTNPEAINRRLNDTKRNFIDSLTLNDYEYGSSQRYVDGFGVINNTKNSDSNGNYIIDNNNFGLSEDINNKIIWGRDGIDDNYEEDVKGLDKQPYRVPTDKQPDQDSRLKTYDPEKDRFFDSDSAEIGLLNYTRELLNSKGKYGNFDLTRKKFIDKNGEVHYQGLPLTENPQGQTDRSRQHTINDPYNRFAKAIRFEGNKIYGGNENSVIYNTVTPKIAPTSNSRQDIKNLMFSIENLAFQVSPSGNILDDDRGVKIPECEIGANYGRLMWFAPYDIKFSEQSVAKHTDTVFLGRSEPIYTYNNTERLATLSFKLLIDYPPQIRNDSNLETQSQRARFFAFGSEGQEIRPVDIGQKQKEIKELEDAIETPNIVLPAVNLPPIGDLRFHFPNDVPRPGNEAGSVQSVIDSGYEVNGLNSGFINGINTALNIALSDQNLGNFKITLTGFATDLFGGTDPQARAYNLALSKRRIEAVLAFINNKFGNDIQKKGVQVIPDPDGDNEAPPSTGIKENINSQLSKTYRSVIIDFEPVENPTTESNVNEDLNRNVTIDIRNAARRRRIEQLQNEINQEKKRAQQGFECTFKQYTLEDGILKGWSSVSRDMPKFQPVFHSQTPEDFHRRLTFLQQCVRQGAAVRSQVEGEDGDNRFGATNSIFGRQPVQILRLGDFYHTKVIIDNITFEYGDAPFDLNPEGMGAQFMYADISMQMKVIGGQSMSTAIDVLQNAVSFNYYANSTFYSNGVYQKSAEAEKLQSDINKDKETEFKKRFSQETQN